MGLAGSEHWLCRWKITGKNWRTIFYQQTQYCMQLLLLSHFSNVINVQKCLLQCVPQKQFLKNGGPLEKVTFHNFQTNVFELVISGSVLNLGGAGRSLMRPRLPSRVEPKSLQGGGRLLQFLPLLNKTHAVQIYSPNNKVHNLVTFVCTIWIKRRSAGTLIFGFFRKGGRSRSRA